jgi:hypothetical protein
MTTTNNRLFAHFRSDSKIIADINKLINNIKKKHNFIKKSLIQTIQRLQKMAITGRNNPTSYTN